MTNEELFNLLYSRRTEIMGDHHWGFDLDEKDFVYGMSILSSQSYGPRLEKYVKEKLLAEKIKASEDLGDFRVFDKSLECKCSIITPTNNKLNFAQVRLWQPIDFYIGVAYDLRDDGYERIIYLLTHDEMNEQVKKYGGVAHGTKKANKNNDNIEMAIRPVISKTNEVFQEWEKYRKYSYDEVFDSVLQ
jgi:hypothetical protein